jgi:hypothetical protein
MNYKGAKSLPASPPVLDHMGCVGPMWQLFRMGGVRHPSRLNNLPSISFPTPAHTVLCWPQVPVSPCHVRPAERLRVGDGAEVFVASE